MTLRQRDKRTYCTTATILTWERCTLINVSFTHQSIITMLTETVETIHLILLLTKVRIRMHCLLSFRLIDVLTVQVPPFSQGLGSQSSMSVSHCSPVYPALQSHSNPGGGLFSCRGLVSVTDNRAKFWIMSWDSHDKFHGHSCLPCSQWSLDHNWCPYFLQHIHNCTQTPHPEAHNSTQLIKHLERGY